jgi:ParB-like chromosome segregation protein Spo0J
VEKRIETRLVTQLKSHSSQSALFNDLKGDDFANLVASLKRDGLTYPIEITTKNMLIDGHQRLRAAKQLGWTEIDVWVRDDLKTPDAVDRGHIEANVLRRQLGQLDQARLIKALWDMDKNQPREHGDPPAGDTRDRIAEQFGIDGRTAQRWVNILRAPMEVQEAYSRGKLSMQLAEKVSRLPASQQQSIARDIRAGKDPAHRVKSVLPARARRPNQKKEFHKALSQMEGLMTVLRDHEEIFDQHCEDAQHALDVLERFSLLGLELRGRHEQAVAGGGTE